MGTRWTLRFYQNGVLIVTFYGQFDGDLQFEKIVKFLQNVTFSNNRNREPIVIDLTTPTSVLDGYDLPGVYFLKKRSESSSFYMAPPNTENEEFNFSVFVVNDSQILFSVPEYGIVKQNVKDIVVSEVLKKYEEDQDNEDDEEKTSQHISKKVKVNKK